MTSPQLAEWVRTRVPDCQPDHAKYLGVVIGTDASAHRWTKVRSKFVAVCAPICRSQSLVWRLVSFKFYALSVLVFASSVSESDKETITAENRHVCGFRLAHSMRSHLPCFSEEVFVPSK